MTRNFLSCMANHTWRPLANDFIHSLRICHTFVSISLYLSMLFEIDSF